MGFEIALRGSLEIFLLIVDPVFAHKSEAIFLFFQVQEVRIRLIRAGLRNIPTAKSVANPIEFRSLFAKIMIGDGVLDSD